MKFQGTCYNHYYSPFTRLAPVVGWHWVCISILALCTAPGSISTSSASFGLYLLAALYLAWQKVPSSYITDKSAPWDGSWDWRPGSPPPPLLSTIFLRSVLGQLLVVYIVLFRVGKEEPADDLHVTSGLAWSKSASGLAWSKTAFSQNCCSVFLLGFPVLPLGPPHTRFAMGASLRSRKILIARDPPVARSDGACLQSSCSGGGGRRVTSEVREPELHN